MQHFTAAANGDEFALFYDEALTRPTLYDSKGEYFAKARDRMDRTFALIAPHVRGKVVLDVGASPFYLLHQAKMAGARVCHGIYFANDKHPLKSFEVIHSKHGPIEISHADVENEGFPFAENAVDVITACEILEHFDHFPVSLAREVRRTLKPGGYFCVTVPNICSIANIIKLIFQKNVYMRYRSDHTGRHKHEFTMGQLKAFMRYLGLDIVSAGYMPSPTSDKYALRPAYRAIASVPWIRSYSPVLYILARQPAVKPTNDLNVFPEILYDSSQSIEG